MPRVSPFYSSKEEDKPRTERRVYHNNSECPAARRIRPEHVQQGTHGYDLCYDCQQENKLGH